MLAIELVVARRRRTVPAHRSSAIPRARGPPICAQPRLSGLSPGRPPTTERERLANVQRRLRFQTRTQRCLGGKWRNSKLRLKEQEVSDAVVRAASAEKTIDSGAGLIVFFDNRDHEYEPTEGVLAILKFLGFAEWLGGDNDYRSVDAFFSTYWNLESAHLLAFRLRWRVALAVGRFGNSGVYFSFGEAF